MSKASPEKIKTARTRRLEKSFRARFPGTEVYESDPYSIRLRIVDERFRGLNQVERERLVWPLLMALPEPIQQDMSIVLLLAEEELATSTMNRVFENPSNWDLSGTRGPADRPGRRRSP